MPELRGRDVFVVVVDDMRGLRRGDLRRGRGDDGLFDLRSGHVPALCGFFELR